MTVATTAAALLLALPTALVAQNVSEVQVGPPSVTLKVGERTGLLATAFDRGGNVIPTVRVFWSSNNIQVARVDNNGTVTGVANGVAIIVARVGPRQGSAAVQVVGGSAPQQVTQAPPPPRRPGRTFAHPRRRALPCCLPRGAAVRNGAGHGAAH